MPADPSLDPMAILASLGISTVTDLREVHGGTDTSIWRVQHGSTTSALRVYRADQQAAYTREIAALESVQRAGIPVPAIQAAGHWCERPALLLAWCSGVPLWEAIRAHPLRCSRLGRAFGQTQAHIHQIPGNDDTAQQTNWIAWAGPEALVVQAAVQRVASPTPVRLHLDYHPLNVLTDGNNITAVLDWANSHLGDPRADVARTYTILMVEPYTPGQQPLHLTLVRRLFAWSWRRGYEQVAGTLTDMAWFYVWAGQVMLRDLAPRVRDPQSWWQAHHLAQVQRWTNTRQRRAETVRE